MDEELLEIARFQYLLADDWEDLSEEVLYEVFGKDLVEGVIEQMSQ